METTLVSYNPNNKVAIGLLEKLARVEGVEVKINYVVQEEEKNCYSKSFSKKMLKSIQEVENGEVVRIDRKTLWT